MAPNRDAFHLVRSNGWRRGRPIEMAPGEVLAAGLNYGEIIAIARRRGRRKVQGTED